jgi:hypothetical protein
MPFVAVCPYCKKGKLNCPDRALGWSGTCPNKECGLSFTLLKAEEEGPAAPASGPRFRPVRTPPAAGASPAAPPGPPKETPAAQDLRADPDIDLGPIDRESPEEHDDRPAEEAEDPAARVGHLWQQVNGLATAALFLAGLGLLAATFFSLDVIPYACGGLAILLGVGGVKAAVEAERGFWLALAGPLVGAATVLIVAFAPSWLNPSRAFEAAASRRPAGERQIIPLRSPPGAQGTAAKPEAAPDWVDASKGVVQFGDLWLRITEVTIQPVELVTAGGQKQTTQGKSLVIKVQAANNDIQRRIDYQSWADTAAGPSKHRVILRESTGRSLSQRTFAAGLNVSGQLRTGLLMPGKWIDDVLVFELPSERFEYLRLTLPLSAFGQEGQAQWHIPRRMVSIK